MAKVTNIKLIFNKTPYNLLILDPEDHNRLISIDSQASWNGNLWIPWIGKESENNKAMVLYIGKCRRSLLYLYQDYHSNNQIKYRTYFPFSYKDESNNIYVDVISYGAGEKILNVLSMEKNYYKVELQNYT